MRVFFVMCALLFAGVSGNHLHAQLSVKGQLVNAQDTTALYGAVIVLRHFPDSTLKGTVADTAGNFEFKNLEAGRYRMTIRYSSFLPITEMITLRDSSINLGVIPMYADSHMLNTVVIRSNMVRVVAKNDTIEMNAEAFKTNPDATAEDLVAKMPGMQVVNGEVKAQGETVQKVLVDGKEYFGEDAASVLRNMPADMVERIQVFDQKSDQAIFSGIDDGNTKKTMNIVTKNQYSNATFGKVYAGYGTEDHYQAGFVVNDFRQQQKFTFLGNFNNINQVNFSQSDLSGISGNSGGGRSGGGSRPGGGGSGRGSDNGFSIGKQNGITGVNSFGMNYSNKWGTKTTVTGSYFFSATNNVNQSVTHRTYYAPAAGNEYFQNSSSESYNRAHRANLRLEYNPDSVNSFVFAPKFNYQYTDYTSAVYAQNTAENALTSSTNSSNASQNTSLSLSGSMNYRHRFSRPGRTLAVELNGSYTDREGAGNLRSRNTWYGLTDSTRYLNQNSSLNGLSWMISPVITWSEKAGKQGIISFTYNPSWSLNISDKRTLDFDSLASDYVRVDSTVSSKYENRVSTNKAGVAYRINKNGISWNIGLDGIRTQLDGESYFPDSLIIGKVFYNLLPSATLQVKKKKSTSIRITYRSSTNTPSVNQLQAVVDNTNPLVLSSGNPYLKQSYTHNLFSRYTYTNLETASSFFLFVSGSVVSDYIGSSLLIAESDTTLTNGVELARGGQYTRPVNLQGYYSVNTFGAWSTPLNKLKSNLNLNWSYGLNSSPGVINGVKNIAFSNTFSAGAGLTSNISEKVDFTLGWNSTYVLTRNTQSTETSNAYYYHTPSAKFNWLIGQGFLLNTDVNYTSYRGLGTGFNQDFILWNASVGYKFAKKQQCEVRITAFDILKQNNSLSRTISETYFEDVRTNALTQYFMLTFTWNIKKFRPVADNKGGTDAKSGDAAPQR
jgi:hypothetical protein